MEKISKVRVQKLAEEALRSEAKKILEIRKSPYLTFDESIRLRSSQREIEKEADKIYRGEIDW